MRGETRLDRLASIYNASFLLFLSLQDVSSKIMSFSQHGPRALCILSANGAISNVMLRQAATSGGTVTYEVCKL